MLRDKAVIGYMGLPDREISVIQSIFTLTEKFHDTYELPREHERRAADVVFVNADDAAQIDAWNRYLNEHSTAIPVFVTTDGRSLDKGITLKRPLILKKIIDTLTEVKHLYAKNMDTEQTATNHRQYLNILVVDDSLPARTYMQQKLASLSTVITQVDFAESGDEAMALLKGGDAHYDLIFMDVMMPGTDGYKTCKWIKANKPNYVVMLTSRSSPFDKVRGAMSGCDTYLVKPPQDSELVKVLKQRVEAVTAARARARAGVDTCASSQ